MDLTDKHEAKHLANIRKLQKKISKHYRNTIDKIYNKAFGLKFDKGNFKISDYPTLSKHIDEVLLNFSEELNVMLVNGVKYEWDESINKNGSIILETYGASKISDTVKDVIFDPQAKALQSFLKRKSKGLGLSDRVWKYTNQFRSEIEKNLYAGISEGKPASAMARDQKQYLQEPDKLFRRVRIIDKKGNSKLVLSKAAREYKPGQGIYRSSYKNAFRLTRNVVNDAYRESDIIKYQSLPFVTGYQVKLADNHPKYDMCDLLKGEYPKSFIWRKWHVNCICFCVPKLPSKEEYDKYEDAILNGTNQNFKFKAPVSDINPAVSNYINDNRKMLNRLKRKPDWMTDNNLK